MAAADLLGGDDEDLPPEERARRERLREVSGGITAYSVAADWSCVAFVLSGTLYVHDLHDSVRSLDTGGPCANPTCAPDGSRVAVTRGRSVVVVEVSGGPATTLLAPGPDEESVSYGSADFIAAEEMGRYRGMWWAPDGDRLLVARVDESPVAQWWISDPAAPEVAPAPIRYPAAGEANAAVTVVTVDLTGSVTPVPLPDFEYLARARWDEHGVLLALQDRAQTRIRTLMGLDPAELVTVAEQDQHPWTELLPGAPRMTDSGLADSEVDPATDTRRLVVRDGDGSVATQTPAGLQVHAVVSADDAGIVFTGSEADPATCDLWLMDPAGVTHRLSEPGGWSSGSARSGTVVCARADLAAPATAVTVSRAGTSWRIPSYAEAPDLTIRPEILRDVSGWGHITVLWPGGEPSEAPLPVVMSPYGGPHAQRSIRAAGAFATEQWLADHGFCVIVADGPGAPSRPTNEFAIAGDLAGPPLAGQIAALHTVAQAHPGRLDLSRVGIRGWSFGGYLAALAVLRRPDVFHAAIAGAPVTEWRLYDTHYTERYLGVPQAGTYDASSLLPLPAAAEIPRPLLLIHGLADDNVVVAHTLQLSSALLAAGYPHTVLPLSGVTHMTPQEVVTENLLRWELEFLTTHLTGTARPPSP